MNIKKLFSVAAVVTFVGSTFLPGLAQAETPDTELGHAYEWAHSKGITTMDTYEKANMYGAITRAEMAKMLSVYATEILGKTADTSKACEFSDIASVGGDLKDFIVKSCQLSVMGQNITAFRPYDTITRAEFGTALSRVLWGDTYNNGTPYYANHLNALKEAGIMKQIANADSTKEIRGYVMIMLQRASEGEDKDLCEMCLATGIGADKCEAVCGNEDNGEEDNGKVKSGDLVVTAEANKGASVISNGATSELDTLTFKASEDITLKSITLERYGLSTYSSIASIWLENEDGDKVTSEKSISSSKDTVTFSIKKDYQNIEDGDSLIVVVSTPENKKSSDLGTNIGFKVIDVDSSAKNLDLSDYSANLYNIIDYAGSDVTVSFKWSKKSYNFENDKFYEVAKLKVQASNAAVNVNGFTLTQKWDLDLKEYIDEVEVLADWKEVKNVSWSTKRDELRVSFADQEIAINKSATFTIKVSLKDFDEFGTKALLYLNSTSDVSVNEAKNSVRVAVKTTSQALDSTKAIEYTFNGGKITLTNTKLSSTIDAAAWSTDVIIAQGKITLGGQAVRLDDVIFQVKENNATTFTYFDNLKLVIGDEEYEATATTTAWEFKVDDVVIEESADVKLLVSLNDSTTETVTDTTISVEIKATAPAAAFNVSTLGSYITYDDVKNAISVKAKEALVGSISISKVKVQPSKASLTNNNTKKAEFRVKETSTKTVFDGTYTAKKNEVNLNKVTITSKGTAIDATDSVTFHVYVDGDEVATLEPTSINTKDDADFSEVSIEAGKSVNVKVEAEVYASATKTAVKYELALEWVDNNNNKAGVASTNMVNMDFVANEGVTITTNSAMKQQDVVLSESDQEIAKFIIKPANKASSANVENLKFDVTDYAGIAANGTVSNDNVDSYFEVKLWDETLDLSYDGASATKYLKADDINIDIEGETTVTVLYKKDLVAGDYKLTLKDANTSTNALTREFSRKAVDALVRVATQEGDNSSTSKYTFEIEYSDNYAWSEEINTLSFILDEVNGGSCTTDWATQPACEAATHSAHEKWVWDGSAAAWSKCSTDTHAIDWSNDETEANCTAASFDAHTQGTWTTNYTTKTWNNVQEWQTYEIANTEDVRFVTEIQYVVGGGAPVSIEKATYGDFFKVGSVDLKAFAKK